MYLYCGASLWRTSMKKDIIFSVIIVSYRNLEILKDTLDSLIRYNDLGEALEIILSDNSPEMDLFEEIQRSYPQVVAIKNENKGFGHGNNEGAKVARGKYLLFLNPDTILVEPIFKFAQKTFEENPKLGLFGVKLVDRERKRNHSYYIIDGDGFWAAQKEKLANALDFYQDGKMYIAGADLFVRREAFMDSGCFDENMFMYSEEPDLTRRVRALGYTTAYFKEIQIIHLEGKTTGKSLSSEKMRLESKEYYCRKHGLDYRKRLVKERNYDLFKIALYRFMRPESVSALREKVAMLNEFIKKEEKRLEQ